MRKFLLGSILLITSQIIYGQNPGSIGTDQSICYGDQPAGLTSIANATGFTPSASYRWQYSTDNLNWTNIASGGTRNTYAPPALTVTTYYRRGAYSATQAIMYSNVVTITVSSVMSAGTIGNSQTICYNTNATQLVTLTAPVGTNGSPVYNWQYSTDNSTWSNVPSGNGRATYTPSRLLVSTYYRRQVTNFTCGSTRNSNVVLITVRPQLNAGVVGPAQSICYSTIPAPINQTTPPSGGSGTYTYQWQSSPNNNTYTNISGATSASLSFSTPLTSSMYYRRIVTSDGCTATSSPVLVTVVADYQGGTIGQSQTICYNTLPNQLTQITPATGGTGSFTYQWQRSSDNISWTSISGATGVAYSSTALTATTYFRRLASSGGCAARPSNVLTITVNSALVAGTISAAQSICYNSAPAALAQATLPTGGSGTYTYQWQSSTDNSTFSSISGATGTTYTPSALTSNTYFRMVVTSGSCGYASTPSILITVLSAVNPGTIGSAQTICNNTVPATLSQLTAPTGGSGVYSFQWQSSADNSTWSDIQGATSSSYSPSALTASTYFRRNVISGSCTPGEGTPVLITVNAAITAVLHDDVTIDRSASANLNVAITGGNSPFTVGYTRNGVAQTALTNYVSGTAFSTGSLTTGTYTYALTSVTDASGCSLSSPSSQVVVTVTPNNTYHYEFTYPDRASLLAAGWDFIGKDHEYLPRNTETSAPQHVISYDQVSHPGILRVPVDSGDLWGVQDNTRNSIFRDLPNTWTSIRLKLKSFNPTINYQQAGLVLYQNDWNYVQVTRSYDYGHKINFVSEILGSPNLLASANVSSTTDIYLRLDRDQQTERITAYYSLNNIDWTVVGSEIHPLPRGPRLGIVCGASPGGYPNADFEWAEIRTSVVDELRVYPNNLVFKATVGQALTTTRKTYTFTTLDRNINWNLSTNENWININKTSGLTPDSVLVSVNTSGLSVGVHTGSITFQSSQSLIAPIVVPVTLIINPAIPVTAAAWLNDKAGAMSVSVDDGAPTGYQELLNNGFIGTYVSNGASPPTYLADYYNNGMELGAHLYSHLCQFFDDNILRTREIELNIAGISANTNQPASDLITMTWPCGLTNSRQEAVASDYFLSGRGYNKNQLEDQTPVDFMNLKSFNSPLGSEPLPPADLKTYVDQAIAEGKWFNLVMHYALVDQGAIEYSSTKDIWVSSIGNVIKYILQRDRLILSNYSTTSNTMTFNVQRLAIPSSAYKNFELAFHSTDLTTLLIDIDDSRAVEYVYVDGVAVPFHIQNENGNNILRTNVWVQPSINKTVSVQYYDESVPRIILGSSSLSFSAMEGVSPSGQQFTISSNIPSSFNWTATAGATSPSWLVLNPASGTGNATITASINMAGLTTGTYSNTITIAAAGAVNTPQTIQVTLTVTPAGIYRYDFTYPDRASFLADGWDFMAVTPTGVDRNTEQLSGAVVSFDQVAHPGVVRIPVDQGDLWISANNTRNTLLRNIPSNWSSIRLYITAFNPTSDYQTAGLAAYQDDNNYFSITRVRNGGSYMSTVSEIGSAYPSSYSNYCTAVNGMYFRIDRDQATNTMTAYFSLDGTTWTQVGLSVVQSINNPHLAVVTGGSYSGYPNADIAWAEVRVSGGAKSLILAGSEIAPEFGNKLHQNYPNPFSSLTNVGYELAEDGPVTIEVYNAYGQKVETVVNENMTAGSYTLNWDATKYSAGIYYMTMKTRTYKNTIKMSVLK